MALTRQTIARNSEDPLLDYPTDQDRGALSEAMFKRMIAIERKRTERTKSPFLLMLIEVDAEEGSKKSAMALGVVIMTLLSSCRDTDLVGWYKRAAVVGAIYTGLIGGDKRSIVDTFLKRISQ